MNNFHFDLDLYTEILSKEPPFKAPELTQKYINDCVSKYNKDNYESIYREYRYIASEISFKIEQDNLLCDNELVNPFTKDKINLRFIESNLAKIKRYHPAAIEQPVNVQKVKTKNIKWEGERNDLCELIWALWKSGRIKDSATDKIIERKKLIEEFENLFNVELKNFDDLLNRKLKTYNSRDFNKTYTNDLKKLIDEQISKLK